MKVRDVIGIGLLAASLVLGGNAGVVRASVEAGGLSDRAMELSAGTGDSAGVRQGSGAGSSSNAGSGLVGGSTNPTLVSYDNRHYRLLTDVDPELARDLSLRLDAMFEEYSRRLSAFGIASVDRLDVYVFAGRNAYSAFIQDRLPNTGGVFIPSKNILAAYLEGQGRDALRRTLQHEAFHQFAHWAISPNMPVWVNEGMAQVFEEGIWTGRRFILEQVPPRRIRQLRADLEGDRLTPFKDFVSMDHRTWAKTMRDRDRGATLYNQAWSMVHFLVYATNADGQPLYRQRFFNMLNDIHRGTSAQTAFTRNFGTNFEGFEQRFREYAARLTTTLESRYTENLEVLSDLLIEISSEESRRFDDVARFRQHLVRGGYRLTYTKGSLRWQSDPDISIYFRDADGRELSSAQLQFVPNPRSPLPDLVLRPNGSIEYRARFYVSGEGTIEREILVRQF
jgi:hypothetical protein